MNEALSNVGHGALGNLPGVAVASWPQDAKPGDDERFGSVLAKPENGCRHTVRLSPRQ